MGKLKVFGKARKTYECDIMIVKLDFTSSSSNTSGSVETSQSQCDCFLQYLSDDCGINIDKFRCDPDTYAEIAYELMTYEEFTGYIKKCLENGVEIPDVVK